MNQEIYHINMPEGSGISPEAIKSVPRVEKLHELVRKPQPDEPVAPIEPIEPKPEFQHSDESKVSPYVEATTSDELIQLGEEYTRFMADHPNLSAGDRAFLKALKDSKRFPPDHRLRQIQTEIARLRGRLGPWKDLTSTDGYYEDPEHVQPEIYRLEKEAEPLSRDFHDKYDYSRPHTDTSGSGDGGSSRRGNRMDGEPPGGRRGRRMTPEGEPSVPRVDWREIEDPELQAIAERVAIHYVEKGNFVRSNILDDAITEIEELDATGAVNHEQAESLLEDLNDFKVDPTTGRPKARPFHEPDDSEYLGYLNSTDLAILDTGLDGPRRWLERKFDTIYKVAQEGQEQNSELIRSYQQTVSYALQYLERVRLQKNPEILGEFGSEFTIRLNLIFTRATVERRDKEGFAGAVRQLTSHGLMKALNFDQGRVESMFKALDQNYEDMRLREGGPSHHVFPEMNARLQGLVIQQQLDLAKGGAGVFAEIYKKELRSATISTPGNEEAIQDRVEKRMRAQITRSVRTAYDVFVTTQRQSVIVARGHAVGVEKGYTNFLSDPGALFANVFNQEDFLTGKFGIYNSHAQEFLEEIKLGIADYDLQKRGIDPRTVDRHDREKLGKRLIRDLAAVPDFWSSSWRIGAILQQIENVVGPEKAGEFGLFLRLRKLGAPPLQSANETPEETAKRIENMEKISFTWRKIAIYKPEEIMRIFRERTPSDHELHRDHVLQKAYQKFLDLNALFATERYGINDGYDGFKLKYGPVISALRERGFNRKDADGRFDPTQIDFARLSQEDKAFVDGVLGQGEGEKLTELFAAMQGFAASDDVIGQTGGVAKGVLLSSTLYEDIYTRTISVDDALLNRLEDVKDDSGLVPVSKIFSSDSGGDALVRNSNDINNAIEATGAFLKFIREEEEEHKLEAAMIFADKTSEYNGQTARATAARFTIGTYLHLSKEKLVWDALGISKSPFRNAISRLQEIYGPQAPAKSRDELRDQLDKYRYVLAGDEGEPYFKALERMYEIDAKGIVKRRGLSFLFGIILVMGLEAVEVAKPKR